MMVLWEHKNISVKDMGELLYLDSGTLTPMLKKMEKAGWITRKRDEKDERSVIISLTDSGIKLKEKAVEVPAKMIQCINLEQSDAMQLYNLLNKLIKTF